MPDSASSGSGPLPDGVVTKVAAGTVAEVTTRFRQILDAKGVTVFAVIDQAAAVIILQQALESERVSGKPPGEGVEVVI